MSDTDDTDLLLLIPPDFFSAEKTANDSSIGKREEKNKKFSKSLLGRVRSLESRLENLEINSSVGNKTSNISGSSDSSDSSLKESAFYNRKKRRETRSLNNSSLGILQSKDPNKMESLAKESPLTEESEDKNMLHDIDSYLTKIETGEPSQLPPQCMKSFHPKGTTVNSNRSNERGVMLEKYIYLAGTESGTKTIKDYLEDTVSSVKSNDASPLKSCILKSIQNNSRTPRKLNYQQKSYQCESVETSTPMKNFPKYVESDKVPSSKNPDHQGNNNSQRYYDSYTSLQETDFQFTLPQLPNELISLSDLWGNGSSDLTKRLEEECMKRKHCEEMIQNLQRLLLEKEEKIAVAMKVDSAKDELISKLRDSCKRLSQNLKAAEDHFSELVEQTNSEKDKLKEIKMEAEQKSKYYENELYKALDLAHDYQEKYKNAILEKDTKREEVERRVKELGDIAAAKESEIQVIKEKLTCCMESSEQKDVNLENLEKDLQKAKEDENSVKSMITELKNEKRSLEEQNSLLSNERDILKKKTREERSRCEVLVTQIHDLQQRLSATSKREEALEHDFKTVQSHLDMQKNELKTYYQKQLEDAVIAKIRIFQEQLDYAERAMETDFKEKEQILIENYNKKIEKIIEQHKIEVSLLEEKQAEEAKLYRLQITQANVKSKALESKLECLVKRRGQIASQLHELMEKQWRQAVQILLNNAHSSGHNSLQNTLSDRGGSAAMQYDAMLNSTNVSGFAFSVPNLLVPSKKLEYESTSSSHKHDNGDCLSDSELQYYVKMLLKKPPSTPSSNQRIEKVNFNNNSVLDPPTSDRHGGDTERSEKTSEKPTKHTNKSNKPPWKS